MILDICSQDVILWVWGSQQKETFLRNILLVPPCLGGAQPSPAAPTRVDWQGWLSPSWAGAACTAQESQAWPKQSQPEPSLAPSPACSGGYSHQWGSHGEELLPCPLGQHQKAFLEASQHWSLLLSREGTCRSCEKHAGRKVLCLSPPDSPHPGRQQLTFIFTSQDLSAAILALKWGLEKAAQASAWALYAVSDHAAGANLTLIGSYKEIHQTGMSKQLVFLVVLVSGYIWPWKKFCWLAEYPICLSILGA